MDYSLSTNRASNYQNIGYTFAGGAEFLGGDLQSSLFGFYTNNLHQYRFDNTRWQYALHDHDLITRFVAGQTFSEGLSNQKIRGIYISNHPFEPRRTQDLFTFPGTAAPGSEIELYRNGRLVGFQLADELGDYRFKIPLGYGSSHYLMQIYEPDGTVIFREQRIDVPSSLLPRNTLTYSLSAGLLDRYLPGIPDHSRILSGEIQYGITSSLTLGLGSEYTEHTMNERPVIYGKFTGRPFAGVAYRRRNSPFGFVSF